MKFYPMHMHLHASHEPTASMGAHMAHAAELGIKHLWITEHDTRMGEKKYPLPRFRFSNKELFSEHTKGVRSGFKHISEKNGEWYFSEDGETISLNISTRPDGYEEFFFYSAGKVHSDPLFAEISVNMDVDITIGENARCTVEFILSAQPPSYKQSKMIYNLGISPQESSENSAYYPFPEKKNDGFYHFDLTADVCDEIGGLDNALCNINIKLEGEAKISFRGFEFKRRLNFEEVHERQKAIAEKLSKKWGVTSFVTFEVSGAGHHRNCYTTSVPCINYKERNFDVSGEDAVRHIKEHGGIFSYNHPFTEWKRLGLSDEEKDSVVDEVAEKISKNHVEGAALIEVGFPYEKEKFYDKHYLRLYDELCLRGIFITADGDSDNHDATEAGWTTGNNFVTYAGLYHDEEPQESTFINAFKRGSCWCGNPVFIKNMQLIANHKFTFGSIFVNEDVEIEFKASKISCKGELLRIVNGAIDKHIEIKGDEICDSYILLPNERFNYIRYEIRNSDGILTALSNPVYSVQNEEDIYPDAELRRAFYGDFFEQREIYNKSIKDGKEFFASHNGTKILHIGDTRADHYKYYQKIISELCPNVIIHTGDLADELKAGRIDADKLLWTAAVPEIIEIMRKSGARCIIVPGNNDLEDKLYGLAPDMEILLRNSIVEIGGKQFCVNHEVRKIDESLGADIHLYGHGFTGESRTPDDNIRDGKKYFNASWGTSLHVPECDADLIIPEFKF